MKKFIENSSSFFILWFCNVKIFLLFLDCFMKTNRFQVIINRFLVSLLACNSWHCTYWMMLLCCRLRPLDISFMKAVHHKVNIVPVIAKSDTLTLQECTQLKRKVSALDTVWVRNKKDSTQCGSGTRKTLTWHGVGQEVERLKYTLSMCNWTFTS